MSKANREIARQAAERVCDEFAEVLARHGITLNPSMGNVTEAIADTYAEAMAERDRYRNALLSNIGHTGHCKHPSTPNEVFFDALLGNIAKRAKEALQPPEATT